MKNLKENLAEWKDWDITEYYLGQCLSLFSVETSFSATKHVFWADNPIGNALQEVMSKLVEIGVLEERDEPDIQYRWNPNFVGSWE
jgi:hypothetical protein